jgi:Winged helix DNA-binding domain
MSSVRDRVLRQRLAVQRLTSPPLADPVDAVGLLLCAQAQDAPLARYSIGMRVAGATDADVRTAIDTGRIVRTHILRPTWHFVAAADLRWILELTSAKVESGLAARHRRLGIDERVIERALTELIGVLADRQFLGRREIATAFRDQRIATANDQVAHLMLIAELRGVVCSGPLRGADHTYALVEEVIPHARRRSRDEAARELVQRFFAGHGPASVADLMRWTTLTKSEIAAALDDLSDALDSVTVDGTPLWFDPAGVPAGRARVRALLLPTFDEAFLSYPQVNFPRVDGHPRGDDPHSFGEAGGGLIVCDRRDVGWWKRQALAGRDEMTVTLAMSDDLDEVRRRAVLERAHHLAAFFGRDLHLDLR